QRVDARGGQGEPDLLVQERGARDDGVVDAERDQRLDVGDDVGAEHARLEGGVADGDELDTVELAEDPGVVAAHRPGADQAGAQRGAHAVAPASLTAATMRSTSASVRLGCTGIETTWAAAFSVAGRSQRGSGAPSTRYGLRRCTGVG